MSQVVEIVEFKLNDGVENDAALKAAEKTVAFVKEQEGFISRHLTCNSDGVWSDVIVWSDMALAQAAGSKFMADARNAEFGQMIDGETVKMGHYTVQMSC